MAFRSRVSPAGLVTRRRPAPRSTFRSESQPRRDVRRAEASAAMKATGMETSLTLVLTRRRWAPGWKGTSSSTSSTGGMKRPSMPLRTRAAELVKGCSVPSASTQERVSAMQDLRPSQDCHERVLVQRARGGAVHVDRDLAAARHGARVSVGEDVCPAREVHELGPALSDDGQAAPEVTDAGREARNVEIAAVT